MDATIVEVSLVILSVGAATAISLVVCPPSGPVSTRTPTQASPTRSEDEDQNDTVIFFGPTSQRGDAHRAVDGP